MSVDPTLPRSDRWLLPAGIEEFLPPEAERLELLRRNLLEMFRGWGYELVVPPLIEYLESLLVGVGHDLEIDTFKLIDQDTGRLMGVRADMTPQVARIDAHRLRRDVPTRLCYLDAVLHTRQSGFAHSRNPLQLGAEIYGHAGIASDIEILRLLVKALRVVGLDRFHIDLGHIGIFHSLCRMAGLEHERQLVLFEILQRKARPDLDAYLAESPIEPDVAGMIASLIDLNGGPEVIDEARRVLAQADPAVHEAIDTLEQMAVAVDCQEAEIGLHYDLAELRGYHYQSGIVFAAFAPGHSHEIARGGRYDEIGRLFGRPRPATGFSADLKTLLGLSPLPPPTQQGILAPPWSGEDKALRRFVRELREKGERVIYRLPDQIGDAAAMGCDREIVRTDGAWRVVALGMDGGSAA